MQTRRMGRRLQLKGFGLKVGLLATAIAVSGCSSLEREYCQTAGECDDTFAIDPVGSSPDSVDVCVVNQETTLSALRANSEEVCQRAADKYEAFLACAVEQGCDAFDLTQEECKDEFSDYIDELSDAGNRCSE